MIFDYIKKIDNSNVINITGISSSGKSTLGQELSKKYNSEIIELDCIFGFNNKNYNKKLIDFIYKKLNINLLYIKGNKYNLQKKYSEEIYKLIIEYYKKQKKDNIIIIGTQFYKFIKIDSLVGTIYIKNTNIFKIIFRKFYNVGYPFKKDYIKRIKKTILNIFKIIFFNYRLLKKYQNNLKTINNYKKIMLLIGSMGNGGAERSIINLSNELRKNNDVFLVVGNKNKNDYQYNCPIYEIYNFNIVKQKNNLLKIINRIIGIIKLKKLKKVLCIDTTISYTTSYNFYNSFTYIGDKILISIRNYLSDKHEKRINYYMHMYSCKHCNKIINVSKAVQIDQIINYKVDDKKMIVIPNFCDINYINSLSNEPINIDNDKKIFISIGRLIEHKGHQFIIKSFQKVVKKDSKSILLIFGRGPYESNLRKLIFELNMQNNIILMGFDSNPYKYLKRARCLILASYYEGFPNVIIEAMCCSTPVIATSSNGGSSEIINNKFENVKKVKNCKYGILIPSFYHLNNSEVESNINLLSNAIIKLLDDNIYFKYKQKSFMRSKDFSNDKIMSLWKKVI